MPQDYKIDEELTYKVCVYFKKPREDPSEWVLRLASRNEENAMILTKYILKTIMGGEWEDPVLEKLVKTEKRYEIATFIMEQEGYWPN